MMAGWSLRLLSVMTGTLLIASITTADTNSKSTDAQQLDGPIITPSESVKILQSGQNFTIYCTGKRPLQLRQQEIPEEKTGSFYMESRNVTSDIESEHIRNISHEIALDLYYVDQFAVGYYACFDDTVDSDAVLSNIIEEPNNTEHISYIYIYVNGSTMLAPMRSLVVPKSDSKFLIDCRPTTPDIKVDLTMPQSNKKPDSHFSRKIGYIFLSAPESAEYKCEARRGNEKSSMHIRYFVSSPPIPKISGGNPFFLEGETFSINCTVTIQSNSPVALNWTIPGPWYKVFNDSNEHAIRVENPILYNNYTIRHASREDAGNYICDSFNNNGKASTNFIKKYLEKPYINMWKGNNAEPLEVISSRILQLKVTVDSYPPASVVFLRDNNETLPVLSKKYVIIQDTYNTPPSYILRILNLDVTDTRIITVVASNEYIAENVTFDVRIHAAPTVDFGPETDKRYLENTIATLRCEATGYPLPVIDWIFSNEDSETVIKKEMQNDRMISLYKITSFLELPVRVSGDITCRATYNKTWSSSATRRFLVYEMPNGFGIKNSNVTWFAENQDVTLTCLASKYDFLNVSWYGEDGEELKNVQQVENSLSYIADLKMGHVAVRQSGSYTCVGMKSNESEEIETISITVAATRLPEIKEPIDENMEVIPYSPANLTCEVIAVPPPQIEWYKDEKRLLDDINNNLEVTTTYINHSIVISMVKIGPILEDDVGKYECRATGQGYKQSKFYNVALKEKSPYKATYITVIGVIFFVLILLVVYLAWKIRKEKQFRKELAAAGLLYFKEGVTKSINPELGIDEQAELLPYDEKFEFPVEKLTLGKQLGAGAFGVVYKADARGIINAEESTTVAVKMVKKTADNMYIKALASELKIMVHLGKHVNIVNLLGACTKNVGKRELIVIVEYCKFGNIHNYMQKHREVFIDQLTDNPEKNLGKVNRGFSSSSGNSGMNSDYFGSNHTQNTDHTLLNTANTNRSGRKVSETGYVQPEWRSNYESDYSFDGRSPRPLCSRDLLAWAFQIARGMEYLASRKVLHGDLAARNILLAEDNIVKICDFGLARSIYKNDEYQKKENSPLPVKWLAIECMTDRIFSTQSDVWSFGIVLWELFSLAKTPYPNISPPNLLQWLSEGRRLEKPTYADDRLYDVMNRCWEQKPTSRPSFSQLQEIIGSFLEDNVRNHYVDLNAIYTDMNIRREGEDYLAMVCAPDYNNLVTPSPHHYVNDSSSFFPPTPTQLQHDDEGYLQMSPATRQNLFNARPQGTKFDFDSRKLNPRVPEANTYGSELTPMLTLNNLPRSGSESDHEGNASPYLNMCPKIEEETDEVFETRQNNAKNKFVQSSAVTNPTYITFSADDQKQNQNHSNNYINVSVPNGLVK